MTPDQVKEILDEAWRLQNQGQLAAAEKMYRQVLAEHPDEPDALNRLATLAIAVNRPADARDLLLRVLAKYPDEPGVHINLASALRLLGRHREALLSARRALTLAPDSSDAHATLATTLLDVGLADEAVAQIERALELQPDSIVALIALSEIQLHRRRRKESTAAAERALALRPDDPTARWNLAMRALTAGELRAGWPQFEFRLERFPHLRREFAAPPWNKQDLAGKTILLHCEAGFGDSIHFVRFVPHVARRAKRVILECPTQLYELFQTIAGADQLIVRDRDPLPPFDVHCSLQSIPFNLDITLETIPADVPYLRASPAKIEKSAEPINAVAHGELKVGLVWSGSESRIDFRSRRLEIFNPLAHVPGVQFFALQVGPAAEQANSPPAGMRLHDLSPQLADFADTAAAIENLDLVIGVDTSVIHLAGALAKPVWTLIPFDPDFRWMMDREDSPWYPTMRLFRQRTRENWDEPIARIAAELNRFRS